MIKWYILINGEIVEEPDILKAAKWLVTADRHICDTKLKGFRISTVFLGLDHRFGREGDPILFETKIFSENSDKYQWYQERYTSIEAAKRGHKEAVSMVNIKEFNLN